MQRVVIMGGPGSGKSTLARELGGALGLPVYHLDRYFWNPGWVQTPWPEFAERIREIAERERWVIDGNYSLTLPVRLARADTVVYLDLPLRVRLPRVLKRRLRYHGQTREDMGVDCPERIDWLFLKQVVKYDSVRHLRAINAFSAPEAPGFRMIRLHTSAEVGAFLDSTCGDQAGALTYHQH